MRANLLQMLLLTLAIGLLPGRLLAGDFNVSLSVSDGQNSQTGKTENDPPKLREVVVRPSMESAFGKRCTASFKITNQFRSAIKDVLVHFYVVRIDKLGQKPPPLEPNEVVIESAQTVDFDPKGSTSGELQFVCDRPGMYLVRIETSGIAEATGSENYAAIDLIVK